MRLSKIKSRIVAVYNYLVCYLPIQLANRLLWIDRQSNWSISIYEGKELTGLLPATTIVNPAIGRKDVTDALTSFVADPFLVRELDNWFLFFEIFNHRQQKGEIAFARSQDGYHWQYQQIILSEKFHLSYPYVFQFEANWYMIPESCEANSVRLYRASRFPDRWEFVTEILVGSRFVDASIVNFNGRWWLFVGVEPTEGAACNTLRLYSADRPDGDWYEHPQSPIVSDSLEVSRPAGRIQQIENRLFRFAQDCTVTYGYNVRAIEIEKLTIDDYLESPIQTERAYLFKLGTMSHNRIGMHHIDFIISNDDRYTACVDSR
ncbi:hypothetical protein [Chamaesiphon sp. VAR_69_metabat_338]|uniref:glucosamine inositolphosphorylceramide transferase family protein n=1 Tax=Chamaesiphon sp. VAR_69_metabat_338 TaxID=2964704 RepID=UPI00286DF856|nr:hypothetical protein [Chamaesiphon sp. VAR_69_metabat_338]